MVPIQCKTWLHTTISVLVGKYHFIYSNKSKTNSITMVTRKCCLTNRYMYLYFVILLPSLVNTNSSSAFWDKSYIYLTAVKLIYIYNNFFYNSKLILKKYPSSHFSLVRSYIKKKLDLVRQNDSCICNVYIIYM